jgi:hypothetical protein
MTSRVFTRDVVALLNRAERIADDEDYKAPFLNGEKDEPAVDIEHIRKALDWMWPND